MMNTKTLKAGNHACVLQQQRGWRRNRAKLAVRASGGGSGDDGSGDDGRGDKPQPPNNTIINIDRAAARLIAAGVTGSAAVVGAALTGVDLMGSLSFDGPAIYATLPLFAPLALLDVALLAPSWRLPPSLMVADDGAESSGLGENSSSPGVDLEALDAAGWGHEALALTLALHQRACLAAPRTRGSGGSGGRGRGDDSPATTLPLPPFLLEAPLAAARTAGQEALRAFAALALAGWLGDRLREAGAGDAIELPAWWANAPFALPGGVGGGEVPLQLVALSLGAALVAATLLPLPVIVAAEAQEIAAAALLLESDAGRAVVRLRRQQEQRRQERWRRRQGQQQQQTKALSGTPSEPRPPASPTEEALERLLAPAIGAAAGDASTAAAAAADTEEAAAPSSKEDTRGATSSSNTSSSSSSSSTKVIVDRVVVEVGDDNEDDDGGDGDSGGEGDMDLLIAEWRLQAASELATASAPARACGWLAFARGAGRLAAAGAALPASGGNWAAPLLGALALDLVLLGCTAAHSARAQGASTPGEGGNTE